MIEIIFLIDRNSYENKYCIVYNKCDKCQLESGLFSDVFFSR